MALISAQAHDFSTLIGRQLYWRNEFRSQLGRAIADAHGLIYAYYDVKMGYPTVSARPGEAVVAPYPVVQSIVSVCFEPKDTEHKRELRIEWPKEFTACYAATERWVKAGGTKPPLPELLAVAKANTKSPFSEEYLSATREPQLAGAGVRSGRVRR